MRKFKMRIICGKDFIFIIYPFPFYSWTTYFLLSEYLKTWLFLRHNICIVLFLFESSFFSSVLDTLRKRRYHVYPLMKTTLVLHFTFCERRDKLPYHVSRSSRRSIRFYVSQRCIPEIAGTLVSNEWTSGNGDSRSIHLAAWMLRSTMYSCIYPRAFSS